jgi:uncharacterized protein YggE
MLLERVSNLTAILWESTMFQPTRIILKQSLPALLALLTIWPSTPLYAEDNDSALIRVSAEAKVKAQPDQAVFSMRLSETALEADEAREEVDAQLADILRALKPFQLEKNSLDTSQSHIQPQYDYRNNQREFRGYQFTRTLKFTLADLDQMETLIRRLTELKVGQLNPVQFALSDPQEVQNEALMQAITLSKQRARQIAKAYGMEIGKLHSANYFPAPAPVAMRNMALKMEMASADQGSPYIQQDMEFSASVEAAFYFH